jgi:putative redox protein
MSDKELSAVLGNSFTVQNSIRGLEWISDEPEDLGGENLGPKPSELFLSSLASCKLITMRMYAQRKDWDLRDAKINLEFIEKGDRPVIRKKVEIEGDLTEGQIKRLIDISGRCPVAKMVKHSVTFELI